MVRLAIPEDRLRVVRLLKDYWNESGLNATSPNAGPFTVPFEGGYAVRLFETHLRDKSSCCIVYEDHQNVVQGILFASASDHPFGALRIAKEVVFFVKESARGGFGAVRMIKAYIDWAIKDQRCKYIGLSLLPHLDIGDRVEGLYRLLGFVQMDSNYLKVV